MRRSPSLNRPEMMPLNRLFCYRANKHVAAPTLLYATGLLFQQCTPIKERTWPHHLLGVANGLQKPWVLQNFCRISRVSQSRFLSGYVRLAVSFFYTKVSRSLDFFARLRVPIRLFVCFLKLRPRVTLLLNFINVTFNFRERVNPNFL